MRAKAFDELNANFKGAKNSSDQLFKDHSCMWKKYLSESHPNTLDKCVDALQSFLDYSDPKIVVVYQIDIMKGLVEKCIGNPKTKLKGIECFNLLFEVTENFDDISSETLIELLNSKT